MARFFGGEGGGFRIDPSITSTIDHDYWEEFNRVNNAFSHEPDIVIRKVKRADKKITPSSLIKNGHKVAPAESVELSNSLVYPKLPQNSSGSGDSKVLDVGDGDSDESLYQEYRSIAVQTDGNYDDYEPELPYKCCFCCRSSTPCVVWIFIAISIIFFKMGAIVTGRWIYLSSSSFDEVVFYIAFTICLGFATIYFRRGTKYHNPYDLLFLMLTVPIMCGLLTFTTSFLKKDMFFYVGSGIYSVFLLPYTGIGSYITYRFWKQGKMFLKRVEGNKSLESACRKLFFAQSLMTFDTQLTICASIVTMAPSINHDSAIVWISSLVYAPISIILSIIALIIGYHAIRREIKRLTILYTALCANQFILVICMVLKRPKVTTEAYSIFINTSIVFWATSLLIVHIGVLVVIWNWIVPGFGKGLKGPISRTSGNNCIQCAQLTICR